MRNYTIRRIIYSVLMMFLASTFVFFILHATPGNPYSRMLGEMDAMGKRLPPGSHMARLYQLMGLERPIHERYVAWLQAVATGDLGATWSIGRGQSVARLVLTRVPYTVLLMLAATVFAALVAFPLGLYSALHPYSDGDMVVTSLSFFGMAMPSFWFGLMAISIAGIGLGWLPIGGVVSRSLADHGDIVSALGRLFSLGFTNQQSAGFELRLIADGLWHLILPTITLSLVSIARWSRFLRAAILDVLGKDFVRTARAFGVSEGRILRRHVLRNALVPMITIMTLDIPTLFTGAVITEIVFSWPGMGKLYVDGVKGADWPLVQGLLLVNTALIVVANLFADLAYGVADPRIKYS